MLGIGGSMVELSPANLEFYTHLKYHITAEVDYDIFRNAKISRNPPFSYPFTGSHKREYTMKVWGTGKQGSNTGSRCR